MKRKEFLASLLCFPLVVVSKIKQPGCIPKEIPDILHLIDETTGKEYRIKKEALEQCSKVNRSVKDWPGVTSKNRQ